MERCEDCDFRYDELAREAVALALRRVARQLAERLVAPVAGDVAHELRLRAHPIAGAWSALEYACHVRDVLSVQRARVRLVQVETVPEIAPMGREERVATDRYNEQAPSVVAQELVAAAVALAVELESLDAGGWERRGVYNWPSRGERTVEWMAVHTVHELVHHLRDVDDLLAASAQGSPPRELGSSSGNG